MHDGSDKLFEELEKIYNNVLGILKNVYGIKGIKNEISKKVDEIYNEKAGEKNNEINRQYIKCNIDKYL